MINIKTKAYLILFLYTLFILATLPIMPEIWKILGARFGKSVTFVPYVLGAGLFSFFIFYILFYKEKRLVLVLWLSLFFIICFFFMKQLELPAERIHLLEYGVLGYLIYKALENDLKKRDIYLLTPFVVFGISIFDEGIQYLLPNRVGDFKDVFLNWFSGILGLIITGLIIKSEIPDI